MSQCWLWTTKYRLGYPKRILVSNVNVNKTIFKLIYYSLFAGWIMINTKILWPWNYLLIFPFLSFFFFGFWKLCSISIISNILTHFQSMSHYCTKYLKYLWTLKYCTCMKRSDDVLYITRISYAFNCVSICEWFLANLHVSGAVVQRCSTKKVFLENPPNLPKNACVFLRFPANSVKSLGIQLL